MELIGHLWNLVTSGIKAFLIALIATGILLWFYSNEMVGLVGLVVRVIFVVSLSGTLVNVVDFLRVQIPAWLQAKATADAALERKKSDDEMTFGSIYQLNNHEKSCLMIAIGRANETGMFRKWDERRTRYDGPTINDAFKTLKERKMIVPSNPAQSGYPISSVDFWKLTPIIVENRSRIIDILS